MALKIKAKPINSPLMLFILSVFQLVTGLIAATAGDDFEIIALITMICFVAIEWLYFIFFYTFRNRRNFELELIAFFLTGVGLVTIGSIDPNAALKQMLMAAAGVVAFSIMIFILEKLEFCMKMKLPVAIAALLFLAVNIVLARRKGATNGAFNWINIAGFKLQPSEFVKIAFIFVGSTTLEKILKAKNILAFIVFSVIVVGSLAIIRDYGTALIFFATFLILAFMNSGNIGLILLAIFSVGAGGAGVLYVKPYVRERFAAYRHVWEQVNEKGYQQTRVLVGLASGGLFGVGIGNGYARYNYAPASDAIFGVICEEWGFLFGILLVLAFVCIGISALLNASASRSTFYSIAAISSAGMLLFQCALNIFGMTDILPLTGVTIPFVSQGGSSLISCWAILAFIKAADTRTYNYAGGKRR